MAIFRRTGSILLTGVATAAMIGLSVAPASAANNWKVSPGGTISAKSGKTTLVDKTTGTTLTCTSSKASGKLKSGSGLSGTGIGSIAKITFSSCNGPVGLVFTVTAGHLPWKINASSYNSTTGVTTGTITGIHAKLSGPGCTAIVDGTSSTANNGKVKVTYTNKTAVLKVSTSGGNLHTYSVNGCAGLVKSGDADTFSASYVLSPKQTIKQT